MLERRKLAPNMDVSVIGLGTVKLGRNTGVKYPSPFDLPSDADAANLISQASELGINLIDTAPAYGLAEARLGQLLKGQRQHWILGSKVGEYYDGETSHFDFSYAGAQASVHQSLGRLQTDYLDYVLLHSDGNDTAVLQSGALQALQHAKAAGDIRAIGISSKTLHGAKLAIELDLDIIMITINPHHLDEVPAANEAGIQGKGVLVKKAMGSGHLSADESLPMVAQTPGVSAIIAGTLNPNHLRANVATLLTKD